MDFSINEIAIFIDKKLPYSQIESKFNEKLKKEENEVQAYIDKLSSKEKEAQDYQDKIVELNAEIADIEQRLSEDDDLQDWEMKLLAEELSSRQTELEIYQHNAERVNFEYFKEQARNYLNEKEDNIVFVYDISRLGISDETFSYIESVARQHNASHNKAKISFKMLSDTQKLTGKVPGIMTVEELDKIAKFRDYAREKQLTQNGDIGIREIADENDCTIESVIKANSLVKKVAQEIMDMGLTPFEAGLHIHEFCSNFYFANNFQKSPRVLESIVENGTIVCVGYGTMAKAICDELDMEGLRAELNIGLTKDLNRGHLNCRFILDDKTYNLKGTFMDDPSANAKTHKNENDFSASFYSLSDVDKLYTPLYLSSDHLAMDAYSSDFSGNSRNLLLLYEEAKRKSKKAHKQFVSQDSSPVIPLETFRKALMNKAIKQGMGTTDAINYVNRKINDSISSSVYIFNRGAKNAFYKQAKRQNLRRKLSTTIDDLMQESDINFMAENTKFIDDYMDK